MELKILAKNTMMLASPKVLKFVLGIVRSKLIAIFLGTEGAGIMNQLMTTVQQISVFSLASMPDGVVKLIAKENSNKIDPVKIGQILLTYFVIIIPITTTIIILGYFYADKITIYILGDIKYLLYYKIAFIAVPISILRASSFSLLKAFKDIKAISLCEFIILIVNFIVFIPLIYFYKVDGAVVFVTLSYLVSFTVVTLVMNRNILSKHAITFSVLKKSSFEPKYFKELLGFLGFGLIAGSYYIFTEVSTRSILVTHLGIAALGIYAPITSWARLFVGFISPSLRTYLFPRMSEAKNDQEIVGVVNDVFRLMTYIALPFIILGISLREIIIPIFYSKEFIDAAIYLPYHFSAILFTIWSSALMQIFAPTGRLRIFMIFAVLIHSITLALVYFLVPLYGMWGYVAKFTISPIISFIIYFIYWNIKIDFVIKKKNYKILTLSVLIISLLFFFRNSTWPLYILAVLSLVSIVFSLESKERNYLINKILRKTN